MPNKLRLNLDFAKLQGAFWIKSPRTGEDCLVIVPSKSRMKRYNSKKPDTPPSLYGSIEIVPLVNPPLDREDTHFAVEPSTQEERADPQAKRLPILGNAREYFKRPEHTTSSQSNRQAEDLGWGDGDDSIARSAAESGSQDDDEIPF